MKRGFTLLELLVVVTIIGIISAIALPRYKKSVNRGRMMESVSNLSHLQKGIDMYRTQVRGGNRTFLGAGTLTRLDVDLTGGLTCDEEGCRSETYNYTASCNGENCNIVIEPRDENAGLPTLAAARTKSGMRVTWDKTCSGGDPGMCTGLAAQGFLDHTTSTGPITPPRDFEDEEGEEGEKGEETIKLFEEEGSKEETKAEEESKPTDTHPIGGDEGGSGGGDEGGDKPGEGSTGGEDPTVPTTDRGDEGDKTVGDDGALLCTKCFLIGKTVAELPAPCEGKTPGTRINCLTRPGGGTKPGGTKPGGETIIPDVPIRDSGDDRETLPIRGDFTIVPVK